MKKFISIFLGLFLLQGTCNATIITEQMLTESEVEKKIENTIYRYNNYQVRYYTYNRNVILVSDMTEAERNTLINEINKIHGVDHVIYVNTHSNSPLKQAVNDSVITAKVEAKLFSIKGVNSLHSHVKTIGGGVCCAFVSLEKGTNKQKVIDELKNIDGVNNIVFCYSYR